MAIFHMLSTVKKVETQIGLKNWFGMKTKAPKPSAIHAENVQKPVNYYPLHATPLLAVQFSCNFLP